MILRIAAGLARNPAPEHRWRRVALPLTSAVFVLLVLAGSSVVAMARAEAGREAGRTPVLANEPSPSDLRLAVGFGVWHDEQYPVGWIEPVGKSAGEPAEGAAPALPPGVGGLPKPGQAVVSPALDRLASAHPALARRYPDRLILGEEGVRGGDELFAYVRVPEGRTLAGDGSADRVSGFGPGSGAGTGSFSSSDAYSDSAVPTAVVFFGVLGLLVLPGLLVVAVGVATASEVRDRRFEVLRRIGAPGRTLVGLSVAETLILALPGMLFVAFLWALAAPLLGRVPLVGHDVVRGDLGLPWWVLGAEFGICLVAVCLVSTLVTTVRRRRGRGGRGARSSAASSGSPGRARLSRLRALPLALVLGALALGTLMRGNVLAAYLNVLAMALSVVAVPLILPGALRAVGGRLGRLESASVSVVGRSLQWDPVRVSRPFIGVAGLVLVVLVGGMFVTLARSFEAGGAPGGQTQAVFVGWSDPHQNDLEGLASEMHRELVVPFDGSGRTPTVGATCSQVAPYLPGTRCDRRAPHRLPELAQQRLAQLLAPATYNPRAEVRLAPAGDVAGDVAAEGSALVLGSAPLAVLEDRAGTAAAVEGLPVPNVFSALSYLPQESPLIPWIVGGVSVAVMALAVGCLVSLVDRLLGTRGHRRQLLNIGAAPRWFMALEAWQFGAPYATVLAISFSAGVAICALITGFSGTGFPWYFLGVTLLAAGLSGLAGVAGVVAFGARSIRQSAD